MHSIRVLFVRVLAVAVLLQIGFPASVSAPPFSIPAGELAVASSDNDLVLTSPTTAPQLYTVQASSDLVQWADAAAGVPGDGTLKTVTLAKGISGRQGFWRLLIQKPASLLVPQDNAFAILGYWCGGIQEKVYVTGFDPATGNILGNVHLSTSCSTGRAGSPPSVRTAWAAVTWDLAGIVISSSTVSNSATIITNLVATDAYSDTIYNLNAAAYLVVPIPAAPSGVTAAQSGDQLQVSWTPTGVNPAAITSSTLTATPVNSTNPVLTTTAANSATTGVVLSLQPQTTYQVTVFNTTIRGSGPASSPVTVTTSPATVPPSAPATVAANWSNLDPLGATDTLVANWSAADPGNSPIDQYLVTITGSDGAGTFTQTVPGTTLTAYFNVDYIPNWSVTIQAHNAAGWGPVSSHVNLGGL